MISVIYVSLNRTVCSLIIKMTSLAFINARTHTHTPTENCHLFLLTFLYWPFSLHTYFVCNKYWWPMPNGFKILKNTSVNVVYVTRWLLIMLLEPCSVYSFCGKNKWHCWFPQSTWTEFMCIVVSLNSLPPSQHIQWERIQCKRSLYWFVYASPQNDNFVACVCQRVRSSLKKARAISTMIWPSVYPQRHSRMNWPYVVYRILLLLPICSFGAVFIVILQFCQISFSFWEATKLL